jgi:energy-coupling factor transport system permease protein
LARRLLAGSLDRAVDVAATLELRGYSLGGPRGARRREPSRHDLRFYAVAAVVVAAAIVGKVIGADDFHAYPRIEIGTGAPTLAVCVVVLASGLAPLRVRRKGRIAKESANSSGRVRATGLPPSLKEVQRV